MHDDIHPVWSFRRPVKWRVDRFLRLQAGRSPSYAEVGATRGDFPAGYAHDFNSVQLGAGSAAYAAARHALGSWKMFPAPWTRISPEGTLIEEGKVIAMQAHALGLWWMNACRILYVIDEPRRFGFAYGTLPAHVEQGEERFLVEWRDDDTVWYDLRAFSRPRYWPVRQAKPLARRLQKRFARESLAAMRRAGETPVAV
jgi:uncharacterized protein (UPF0548 family)